MSSQLSSSMMLWGRRCKAVRGGRTVRWKSSSQKTFSSYEYPLATEDPVVTKSNAKDVTTESHAKLHGKTKEERNEAGLSELEVEHGRRLQKDHFKTLVEGSQPITLQIPREVPPNVSSSMLEIPETHITTLDNGLKVASQETYGQVTSVGLLANVGSRQETVVGTAHLLEVLGFPSTTKHPDGAEIQERLQNWGATHFCSCGREQSLWCVDILRPNVRQGMELIQQVTMEPLLQPEEVHYAKQAMAYQAQDVMPETVLSEALQHAAYRPDQQLGKPHFCPEDQIDPLQDGVVRDFLETNVWNNPEGLVIAGAGIGHDELVDMAHDFFGHLKQSKTTSDATVPSLYRGGYHHTQLNRFNPYLTTDESHLTRVAVAVEVEGGWNSDDLVPACVLQTLLGGGNSFSAGGPGKGMYSRLYRQVLNRYFWAESAEAFTAFHHESGLLGISGSCIPNKSQVLTAVLVEHLYKTAGQPVADEELQRAKNMLKNNVLSQLESRLVLFEDMARQTATYGHRETMEDMCKRIDAVTKEDLMGLMQRATETKAPTLAVVTGASHDRAPTMQDVERTLNVI